MPSLSCIAVSALVFCSCESPPINYANRPLYPVNRAPMSWTAAMKSSIRELNSYANLKGKGSYSTSAAASSALHSCFSIARGKPDLYYFPQNLSPSYCSGAVHSAVLGALMNWDLSRPDFSLTKQDWAELIPRPGEDGERVWGWANANGPGYAVLVHQLGAGYSFTDWGRARPLDIIKMWWTDELGGHERGHIAILIAQSRDEVLVWGSHTRNEKGEEGVYLKTFPKSKIKRVLFTRITDPAAFANAEKINYNSWLNSLLRQPVSWEECLRRSGVR